MTGQIAQDPIDDKLSDLSHCFHCGFPVPKTGVFSGIIEGQSREFCCAGCRAVCIAIHHAGLEAFYQQGQGTIPPAESPIPEEVALFDLDEVQGKFVCDLGAQREINLLVEGIHCPACVWLIEHALEPVPGVLAANVNLSGKRLRLRWDNTRVPLSQLILKLGGIGYSALPFDPEVAEGRLQRESRALLYRIVFAGFAAMNLMWTSIALYTGAATGEFRDLFQWVGLVLATPTLLYSGYPFLHGAWVGLKKWYPTMDLPIAIGAITTYAYSTVITLTGAQGGVYFDTLVNFLFVILVGRFLESASRRKAVAATQRMLDLQPRGATVLRNGQESVIPIEGVELGESVLVRPGKQIPVDGRVFDGHSDVDESLLTGESRPVLKEPGDNVFAGSLNQAGALVIEVTATLNRTTLGRILHLIEEAQSSRAPIQSLTDRIVPWFVSLTLLLALATFLWWWWVSDFSAALMAATTVLIVTCPCAFGLATPMAIAVASGLGAQHGILVKSGTALESLSRVGHVVFDKTGTLTTGRMKVNTVLAAPGVDSAEVLRMAAAVEGMSEHGIARAIVDEASRLGLDPAPFPIQDFENHPGRGVRANIGGVTVVLGSKKWLLSHQVILHPEFDQAAASLEKQAATCVHVAIDGREIGLIGIVDQLRDDARSLVDRLRTEAIRVTLLSGDRRRAVKAMAAQLGGMDVLAEVLPEHKERIIAEFQRRGEVVAMVGDGVNDAPALARADVGIAVGSGADVSLASADIVLMSNELAKVHLALRLARRTLSTVRRNISISIAYNLVMVPLAMSAIITPLIAAIAMPISSLLVIGNAMRIRSVFEPEGRQWK